MITISILKLAVLVLFIHYLINFLDDTFYFIAVKFFKEEDYQNRYNKKFKNKTENL